MFRIKYLIFSYILMFSYNSHAGNLTVKDSVLTGGPPVVTLSNSAPNQGNNLGGGDAVLKPSNACAHFCGQSSRMFLFGKPTTKGVEIGRDGQIYRCNYSTGCIKYSRFMKNPATGMAEMTDIDVSTLIGMGGCVKLDNNTSACLGKSGVTYKSSTCTPDGILGETCTANPGVTYPWLDEGSTR